jgi:hypothetical protein
VIPKYVYFGQGQDEKEDCTIPALCTGYYSSQLEEVMSVIALTMHVEKVVLVLPSLSLKT